MLKNGFIPAGTKIYLKNKELIEIENLKFGDEILSIKILDDEINTMYDILYKYFASQDPVTIDSEKLELSSSHIINVQPGVGSGNKQCFYLINNSQYARSSQPILTIRNVDNKKELGLTTTTALLKRYSNNTDTYLASLQNNNIDNLIFDDKKIESIVISDKDLKTFSMALSNNNFCITEHFILLGVGL